MIHNAGQNLIPRNGVLLIISMVFALGCSLALAPEAACAGRYTDTLAHAVTLIDQGQYNTAVMALDEILAAQPGELVGQLALAVALSHTRKVDLAIEEYRAILAANPADPLAAYGLGVCMLSQGHFDKARELFIRAEKSADWCDSGAALAYVDYLKGRYTDVVKSASAKTAGDPAEMLLLAAVLRSQGQNEKAHGVVVDVIEKARVPKYDQDHGAIITLDKKSPVNFNGQPLLGMPQMRVSARKGTPTVKGEVTLRVDAASLLEGGFAVFYVDGAMVAMSNQQPLKYVWDTTQYSNGFHTVTVAVQSGGVTLDEKTQRYWVQNSGSDKMRQIAGPEADRLTSILWNRMRIRPSLTIAYYFAAKYHLVKGNVQDATAFLEKTVACDPDYADTRALLARCYGQSGYKQVTSGPKGSKVVALTFDDGPNATTPIVLDILESNNVKATFFVVGSQVESNPSIVKTMSEQGHQIESHTFSHRNIERLPRTEVEQELMKAAAAIRDSTGKESRFFRPPGGHAGATVEAAAADYGLTGVFWTVACSKFEGSNPESMVQHVLTSIDDGGILLMHNGEEVTLKALPVIIAELRNRGYRFATLSELVGGR